MSDPARKPGSMDPLSQNPSYSPFTNDHSNNNLRSHGNLPSSSSNCNCNMSPNLNPNPNQNKWSKLMTEKILSGAQCLLCRKKKIMHAPKAMRQACPKAYTPELLSIGPVNACFCIDTLSPVDSCKALFVNNFLATCTSTKGDKLKARSGIPFQSLENLMVSLFKDVRNPGEAYFDIPNYNEETLKLLITVDSIFVLEFLCYMYTNPGKSPEFNHQDWKHLADSMCELPIINNITLWQIKRDLFIYGNQVQLSNLYSLAEYAGLKKDFLLDTVWGMVWEWIPFTYNNYADFRKLLDGDKLLDTPEHLLDCLYQACVMSTDGEKQPTKNQMNCIHQCSDLGPVGACCLYLGFVKNNNVKGKLQRLPRASELRKVGIKFKAVDGNASAIKYDRKKLIVELPKLVVDDRTECILRNLIAHELTSGDQQKEDICSYVVLMYDLMDKTDDLDILYRAGVVENLLGSDEQLIAMWNQLGEDIRLNNPVRLEEMTRAIMTHYSIHWRQIYGAFRRRYFYILPTVVGLLLFFMTPLDTLYTALTYYGK